MDTKAIGEKIATARKLKNFSQAQLAELLFISPQAIGKWERGESMPDLIMFRRLTQIFGVDLNYFIEDDSLPVSTLSSCEVTVANNGSEVVKQKKLDWDMSSGRWRDADFSGLTNLYEKFSTSHMERCKFIGSEMSGLTLDSNRVDRCDFSESGMAGCKVQSSHLTNNWFVNADLRDSEFSVSDINNCDFTGADLTGVVFNACSFRKILMKQAVLKTTSFKATHIDNVIFEGTIEDCYFENSAFKKVTFINATIVNTFFKCKTLKGINFIDCQADRLTYEFLKNGKADMNGITLLT